MTIIGNSTTWSEYNATMLLFSNEIHLKDYLSVDLWSEDYNTAIHAKGYQEYTDGYSARVLITFLYEKLDETLDGFGMILSEYGYQLSYDGEGQDGLTRDTINAGSVQGWNGFALHRADSASVGSTFDYSLKNVHLEKGQESDENLDIYEDVPSRDEYEGSWSVESWTDSLDGLAFTVTLNRYLPIWTYDVYENYFNDYRWSPSSPPVEVRGYYRDASGRDGAHEDDEAIRIVEIECETDSAGHEICTEDVTISFVKIHWTDLITLEITQAGKVLAATGGLMSAIYSLV